MGEKLVFAESERPSLPEFEKNSRQLRKFYQPSGISLLSADLFRHMTSSLFQKVIMLQPLAREVSGRLVELLEVVLSHFFSDIYSFRSERALKGVVGTLFLFFGFVSSQVSADQERSVEVVDRDREAAFEGIQKRFDGFFNQVTQIDDQIIKEREDAWALESANSDGRIEKIDHDSEVERDERADEQFKRVNRLVVDDPIEYPRLNDRLNQLATEVAEQSVFLTDANLKIRSNLTNRFHRFFAHNFSTALELLPFSISTSVSASFNPNVKWWGQKVQMSELKASFRFAQGYGLRSFFVDKVQFNLEQGLDGLQLTQLAFKELRDSKLCTDPQELQNVLNGVDEAFSDIAGEARQGSVDSELRFAIESLIQNLCEIMILVEQASSFDLLVQRHAGHFDNLNDQVQELISSGASQVLGGSGGIFKFLLSLNFEADQCDGIRWPGSSCTPSLNLSFSPDALIAGMSSELKLTSQSLILDLEGSGSRAARPLYGVKKSHKVLALGGFWALSKTFERLSDGEAHELGGELAETIDRGMSLEIGSPLEQVRP